MSTLVAFLPDSELPGLTLRERQAARNQFKDWLHTQGYLAVTVVNAPGQHYLTHCDHSETTPIYLPRFEYTPEGPPAVYIAALAIGLGLLVWGALVFHFGDMWRVAHADQADLALTCLAGVGLLASFWSCRR